MTTTLTVSNCEKVGIAISQDAEQAKAKALEVAGKITAVKTADEATLAVAASSSCKKLVQQVEKSRKDVKGPVLEIGKRIDSIACQYAHNLQVEIDRIEGLMRDYEIERQRKQREEEEKRQAELRRVEEERRKAEEAAARAKAEQEEKERREAELAFKERTKKEDKELERIQRESAQAAAKAEEEERKAKIAELKQHQVASQKSSTPQRTDGTIVRDEWLFEVTDIKAFYAAKPDACKIEVQKSMVNALLRNGMRECPGLSIWCEKRVITRA